MEPPQRWTDIVVGKALGFTQAEIAAGLDESQTKVSATVSDIQSTLNDYEDPTEFLQELLGAEVEANLDLDAIREHRESDED